MSDLKERSLKETPTWAVAVVCLVLLVVSIIIEHVIHHIGSWLEKRNKRSLYGALEKIKAELMLLGFMSLLLTVLQDPISRICIPMSVGSTWYPCKIESTKEIFKNTCTDKTKVPFVSYYGTHQLHIFLFVLALFHVVYCVVTLALGTFKMRTWKTWEDETKTAEYQYSHDPERFRYARETSFGSRHLNFWSRFPVLLWIVCFFRQFFRSVHKQDYLALRHGFIVAHLGPESDTKFDFQKYINRSLEEDFKVVVGISPVIWFCAVLFLLTNTYGWYSYFWLPFIPLFILLLVGTKLQVIITEMGLRILERGVVVKGTPVVELGDDLFWFNRPRLILFLINFVLFLNAFQLAFFAWSVYGLGSCNHEKTEDVVIRISMGVIIQVLCSYVTLPLYALVTQMGSTMRSTVFNDDVAGALRNWHDNARKHRGHGRHSDGASPQSSRPATPSYGMSPVHLLQSYDNHTPDMSPRASNSDSQRWYGEGSRSPGKKDDDEHVRTENFELIEQGRETQDSSSTRPPLDPRLIRTQHEINITASELSFRKSPRP